jgi:hypothetical protein
MAGPDRTDVFEGSAGPEQPIRGRFWLATTAGALRAEVRASAKPPGPVLTGFKLLVLPPFLNLLGATTLTLRVRPIVKRILLEIPFASDAVFTPDNDVLAQKLRDLRVTDDMLASDPVYELHMWTGYTVRVTYFIGDLMINQIV